MKAEVVYGELSYESASMEARKSSTCFNDKELWRVSRGQMEGTMEYNSKPEKEKKESTDFQHEKMQLST